MKVLIIEDEKPAAEKLIRYLNRYDDTIEVINTIDNIRESVTFLQKNQDQFDLLFLDIQLKDGKSFEIFEEVELMKPVIFTTAYDHYAIQAFKLNSIAYLLKPYTYAELCEAMDKYIRVHDNKTSAEDLKKLHEMVRQATTKNYKQRFMVKIGDHLRSISVDQISVFYADGRIVYLITNDEKKYIVDYRLEELEDLLDPEKFKRINRSVIVEIDSIEDVTVHSNSRLKVFTNPKLNRDIIVSRDKVGDFKDWYSGN